MKHKIDSRQILKQRQNLSYHQRYELDILEISNMELQEAIQNELESNPCLEQDMSYETGHIQKEETNFELLLNYVVKEKTLSEELYDQIRWCNYSIHTDLAYFIADMLDSNGYLTYKNEELLKYFPQYDESDVEETIKVLQMMEPRGIAARSLSECLLIQLSSKEGYVVDIARHIVRDHLEEVASNHVSFLAKQMKTSLTTIQDAINLIKSLDPKPGARFSNTASYLKPDLYCYIENGEIHLELMNETYGLYLSDFPKMDRKEYRIWNRNALNLISAIKKRNQTLLKVGYAVCRFQQNYFIHSTGLKPCTMKQIAVISKIHESTVSRCIAGKSLIFNDQVIPLKYFFPKGLALDSVLEIQDVIRTLIKQEDPCHPLSDESISVKLGELDYQVSRRTVAKYRENMKIASSARRKKK